MVTATIDLTRNDKRGKLYGFWYGYVERALPKRRQNEEVWAQDADVDVGVGVGDLDQISASE